MVKDNTKQPELKFPVDWNYHIIVDSKNETCEAELTKLLTSFDESVKLTQGRESAGGKYRSLLATVTFNSLEEMNALSHQLSTVNGVKYLL